MEGCLVPPYKDRDWTVWTTLPSWCFSVLSFGWSSLRVLPGLKWTMMLCLGKILLRFSERPPELHLKLLLSPICWLRISLHRSVAVEWNGWGHLQWASWSSEGPQWRSHLSGFQPWWWTAALWWERQGACLDKIWSCLSCCKYSVRNVSKVCNEFLCTITFLFSFFNIHDFSWPNLYEKCLGFSNTVSWDCKYTFLCQCSVGMFSCCILCKVFIQFLPSQSSKLRLGTNEGSSKVQWFYRSDMCHTLCFHPEAAKPFFTHFRLWCCGTWVCLLLFCPSRSLTVTETGSPAVFGPQTVW